MWGFVREITCKAGAWLQWSLDSVTVAGYHAGRAVQEHERCEPHMQRHHVYSWRSKKGLAGRVSFNHLSPVDLLSAGPFDKFCLSESDSSGLSYRQNSNGSAKIRRRALQACLVSQSQPTDVWTHKAELTIFASHFVFQNIYIVPEKWWFFKLYSQRCVISPFGQYYYWLINLGPLVSCCKVD